MRRTAVLILLAAATVAVAVAVIPAGAGASNPHDHRVTLVAHNDEGTMTPADFFSNPTQNAQASMDAPVYRDGVAAGLAETVFTVTRAGDDTAVMVECSIELAEGNIVFNGSAHLADFGDGVALPVIGGTGRYSGARGTVVMTVTDHARPVLAFDFTTK